MSFFCLLKENPLAIAQGVFFIGVAANSSLNLPNTAAIFVGKASRSDAAAARPAQRLMDS